MSGAASTFVGTTWTFAPTATGLGPSSPSPEWSLCQTATGARYHRSRPPVPRFATICNSIAKGRRSSWMQTQVRLVSMHDLGVTVDTTERPSRSDSANDDSSSIFIQGLEPNPKGEVVPRRRLRSTQQDRGTHLVFVVAGGERDRGNEDKREEENQRQTHRESTSRDLFHVHGTVP